MEVEDLLASACKRQAKDQDQMIDRNNEMFNHLQEFENQGHEAKKKATQVSLFIPTCSAYRFLYNQISRKLQEVVEGGVGRMQRTVLDSVSSYSHWTNQKSEELRKSYNHSMIVPPLACLMFIRFTIQYSKNIREPNGLTLKPQTPSDTMLCKGAISSDEIQLGERKHSRSRRFLPKWYDWSRIPLSLDAGGCRMLT